MNLHGYLAREGMPYGGEEALDFTNLYFYCVTYHAVRTSNLLAQERKQRFDGFAQSQYANGHYFDKYIERVWQPRTARVDQNLC